MLIISPPITNAPVFFPTKINNNIKITIAITIYLSLFSPVIFPVISPFLLTFFEMNTSSLILYLSVYTNDDEYLFFKITFLF